MFKTQTGNLLHILVTINQTCPPGFNISVSAKSCVCEQRLAQYTNQCIITNGVGQITHDSKKQFWVGYDHSSHELILHPHCPFDYCVNDAKTFPLNNTDVQCAYNRSGLLCGHCKEGYSLVLGTVITGTLSGLGFYANIVGVNRTTFLPVGSTDALSVFVEWLNLDFGIETCFYNGMDAYTKTWLQFVFPAYIWVLVGLMIFISHFSQKFANLLCSNPVSLLATLILLKGSSHIDCYSLYPTYNRKVWLYHGNINYQW